MQKLPCINDGVAPDTFFIKTERTALLGGFINAAALDAPLDGEQFGKDVMEAKERAAPLVSVAVHEEKQGRWLLWDAMRLDVCPVLPCSPLLSSPLVSSSLLSSPLLSSRLLFSPLPRSALLFITQLTSPHSPPQPAEMKQEYDKYMSQQGGLGIAANPMLMMMQAGAANANTNMAQQQQMMMMQQQQQMMMMMQQQQQQQVPMQAAQPGAGMPAMTPEQMQAQMLAMQQQMVAMQAQMNAAGVQATAAGPSAPAAPPVATPVVPFASKNMGAPGVVEMTR